MQTSSLIAAVVGLCLGLVGCASVDNDVIVPPGSYTSHLIFRVPTKDDHQPSDTDSPDIKLDWLMPLVEVDPEGFIHPAGIEIKNRDALDKPPIYVSYDISRLENGKFETLFPGALDLTDSAQKKAAAYARNVLVKRVLYLSDKNFDTYALRKETYAGDARLFTSTLNTVGTATIGGTALIAPPAAAGIALTKLIADSSVTNLQNSYLGGQTIDTLFKAMAANRAKYETLITNKLYAPTAKGGNSKGGPSSYDSYPIVDVLGDFRQLNSISTLPGALEDISKTASTQVETADAATDSINKNQAAVPSDDLQKVLDSTAAQAVQTKIEAQTKNNQ